MHGTLDATVPYGGGSILGYTFPGAEDSVDQWVGYDGCDGEGIEGDAVDYETTLLGDETTPTHWEGCDEGARVELWSIAGASHIPNVNDEYRNALVEWLLARRREP